MPASKTKRAEPERYTARQMKAREPKLLPYVVARECPFCGAQATIQPWHGGAPTKKMLSCGNDECDVSPSVTGETRKSALARWNRRYPS